MTQVLEDLAELPLGAHALSFHASADEARDHAVRFLTGTPEGMTAIYWVPDAEASARYNSKLADVAPSHVGCVVALGHSQVDWSAGKLRPAPEIREFLREHPGGVTAGGETLTKYWHEDHVAEQIEYERWFDEQPREDSRFICPYDLRRLGTENPPEILAELGKHHSHIVLSSSREPAVRLLQLFVFPTSGELPPKLGADLDWAAELGYVEAGGPMDPLRLTPAGRAIVDEWGGRTSVDW